MKEFEKFDGFPKECVKFYNDLKKNNSKKWFESHREDYDNYVMDPTRITHGKHL